MALFGVTVGFANANDTLTTVARPFVLMNGNGITEGPFADAKFDIVGYMSHPCFDITGTEVQSCAYNYGISEPLRTSLENGTLLSWAESMNLLPRSEKTTTTAPATTTPATTGQSASMQPTITMTAAPEETTVMRHEIDTTEELNALHIARSNKLWNICLRNETTREAASLCYQRNIRLLMRLSIEISEDTVR